MTPMPTFNNAMPTLGGGYRRGTVSAPDFDDTPVESRQHPFLGRDTQAYLSDLWGSSGSNYADRLSEVTSYSVAGTAPDGTPSVYKVTYADGTSQYEVAPSFATEHEYNWQTIAPEGSTLNTVGQEVGDSGLFNQRPLSYTVSDPSSVKYEAYTPQGLDSFGDFLSVAAPLALGFWAGPAMSSAFGSGMLGQAASGALAGGISSALSGDDPLKGALLGGFGGAAGNAVGGFASEAGLPSWTSRALSSGASSLIRSGGNPQSAAGSLLTGGLGEYLGEVLPSELQWAASPLAAVGSSLMRGQRVSPQSLFNNAAIAALQSGVASPRQAAVKGAK